MGLSRAQVDAYKRLVDAITVGLVAEPHALGLTWDGAYDVATRIAPHLPIPELDAAWPEAEAALPEGWFRPLHVTIGPTASGGTYAELFDWPETAGLSGAPYGTGPTPAAALRALAAKLREEKS
jgi:hypothetical protein